MKETFTVREVAGLLGWRINDVRIAIEVGIRLPHSGTRVTLGAIRVADAFEICSEQLDEFISLFEGEEPGRHPPIVVRRRLLVESGHRCAVCGATAPLQFHHIIEFSKLRHHDPEHMLAVCGVCHDRIGIGEIDGPSQRAYKAKLGTRHDPPSHEPHHFRFRISSTAEPAFDVMDQEWRTKLWKQCIVLPHLPPRLFLLLHRMLRQGSAPGKWSPLIAASYAWFLREIEGRRELSAHEVEGFASIIRDSLVNTGFRAYTVVAMHPSLEAATVDSLNLRARGPDGRHALEFAVSEWWRDVPRPPTGEETDATLDALTTLWARGSRAERQHILECVPKLKGMRTTSTTLYFRTALLDEREERWQRLSLSERDLRMFEKVLSRVRSPRPCSSDEVLAAFRTVAQRDAAGDDRLWKQSTAFFAADNLEAIRRHRGDNFLRAILGQLVRDREVDVLSATLALLGLVSLHGSSVLVTEIGLVEALFQRGRGGALKESVLDGLLESLEPSGERGLIEATILLDAHDFMTDGEQKKLIRALKKRTSRRARLLLDIIQGQRTPSDAEAMWNSDVAAVEPPPVS